MATETSSPKQELKSFLKLEIRSASNKEIEAILNEVESLRTRFSRYDKGKKSAGKGYHYAAASRSCKNIGQATEDLVACLLDADLMVMDELEQCLGVQGFRTELVGKLCELKTASNLIKEKLPYHISEGRQLDRVLYEWVIEMANIYEGACKPKKAHHSKNSKFVRFLKCWKPDEIPEYGDRLSPRTIKRILDHRVHLKHDKYDDL